jgi:hypothetical protein
MHPGKVVQTLRGFMSAVPATVRAADPERWQSRYNVVPRLVSEAEAKLGTPAREAGEAGGQIGAAGLDHTGQPYAPPAREPLPSPCACSAPPRSHRRSSRPSR